MNLRIFVILAIISIAGVVVTQVYWFKKAFDNTEKEFDKNLNIALNETVKGVLLYNKRSSSPVDPVKQVEHNYFAVMVNDQINADVLEYYLRNTFKKFNISESFEYRIYDCANEEMVYGGFIDGEDYREDPVSRKLPEWKQDNYYFTIYFPHKTAGIVSGMSLWLFSSSVVLIVLIFFGYSLFVILQQKRFSEVQKDFINNMTHEIKTPVSIISISAETIKDPNIINTPQRLLNYATIILDEANHLKIQVERVLSLTGKESSLRLNKEEFNLHELLVDSCRSITENIKNKNIQIEYDLKAISFMVNADRFYMANLFSNLIDNAIKYSGEDLKLKVSSVNKPKTIEVSIEDNGIGIHKDHLKKIFDKFYRVPTGNVHNVKGFGIGLNYVQLIAKIHKGSVKVLSEQGKGSVFILTLPNV